MHTQAHTKRYYQNLKWYLAICDEEFCQNDGNCSTPNIDCDCTDEWEGDRCQTGLHAHMLSAIISAPCHMKHVQLCVILVSVGMGAYVGTPIPTALAPGAGLERPVK